MIYKNKNTIIKAILTAALLLIALMCRLVNTPTVLTASIVICIRCTIHVSIIVAWTESLHRRLVNPQIRRILVGTGTLMAFWMIAKTIKYEFLTTNLDPIGRYIWYSYYIPMILIPLFGMFVVDHIGKPEGYRTPKWMKCFYIPALVLIALVLTNDAHQLVFKFHNGFENYNNDYSYGLTYFILMAWYILFTLYFVLMLLRKCRVPGSKKMQKLPLYIALGGVVFWIIYVLKIIKVDLTVIDCLIIASLLESAIQIGMILSNTNHQEIFASTTVPILILDNDYQPHYVSATALPIPEDKLRQSSEGSVELGDTLLNSAPITAGRVVWQDDIRQINEMRQKLQDAQEQLSEEIVLHQAETEIKEKRAKVDEQNRLYDRISREVEPKLIIVDELLKRIEKEPQSTKKLISQVCVYGSYVKRRGNLLLLGEESNLINAVELEYCIRESLENLHLYGAITSLTSDLEGKLQLERVIAVYDFFEEVCERLIDTVTAMMINISRRDGNIVLNIQIGCSKEIEEHTISDITLPYGSFTYDIIDEDIVICLTVAEGGDLV